MANRIEKSAHGPAPQPKASAARVNAPAPDQPAMGGDQLRLGAARSAKRPGEPPKSGVAAFLSRLLDSLSFTWPAWLPFGGEPAPAAAPPAPKPAPKVTKKADDLPTGEWWDMAREVGERHDLDPRLIMAVVTKESQGDPRARSHAGARGLMQLMPATARALGVKDPYNPRQNMEGGARYLKELLDTFDGNLEHALMAYNWGQGNVRKFLRGRKRPPAETRDYVPAVIAYYKEFGGKR